MKIRTRSTVALLVAASLAGCAKEETGTLAAATEALGVTSLTSIEFTGTGKWFQFGQAPNPNLPWPPFDVSSYTASINYETPAARIQMERRQVVEPNRERPAPVTQRPVQVVSGTSAWNLAPPAGAAPDAAPAPQPQPEAVEERTMEIWTPTTWFCALMRPTNL